MKRLGERHSADFIEKIANASSQLFLLFDDMLTVDDVEKGSTYVIPFYCLWYICYEIGIVCIIDDVVSSYSSTGYGSHFSQ